MYYDLASMFCVARKEFQIVNALLQEIDRNFMVAHFLVATVFQLYLIKPVLDDDPVVNSYETQPLAFKLLLTIPETDRQLK